MILMRMEKERVFFTLSRKEIRAIIHWLSKDADGKWYGGSHKNIEEIYNNLNREMKITPRYWKWKKKREVSNELPRSHETANRK